MALPEGPLAPGTKVRLPVSLEVVRDDGAFVVVLIPSGFGVHSEHVVPRAVLAAGEVE